MAQTESFLENALVDRGRGTEAGGQEMELWPRTSPPPRYSSE